MIAQQLLENLRPPTSKRAEPQAQRHLHDEEQQPDAEDSGPMGVEQL
jgi:hypothetical protein